MLCKQKMLSPLILNCQKHKIMAKTRLEINFDRKIMVESKVLQIYNGKCILLLPVFDSQMEDLYCGHRYLML